MRFPIRFLSTNINFECQIFFGRNEAVEIEIIKETPYQINILFTLTCRRIFNLSWNFFQKTIPVFL